ncbi:MAG: hypothetical protein EOO61_00795 [Hymenobacter sp.]|nr:MAG: hypothetical protein EOO61_00795 [Hymenobacter sp.]
MSTVKSYILLKILALLFLGELLSAGTSAASTGAVTIPHIKDAVGSVDNSYRVSALSNANRKSLFYPNGFPDIQIDITKIERCWGDEVEFTVNALNGQQNAPLPIGMYFELFEDTPDVLMLTSTNLSFTLTDMPLNALANIPMRYFIDITDGNGNRGDRVEVYVTWHYIDNKIAVDAGFSGAAPYLQKYPIQFIAEPGNDVYVWSWGDGITDTIRSQNTAVHLFPNSANYNISVTITKKFDVPGGSCSTTGVLNGFKIVTPLCEISLPGAGQFQQNTRSGAVSFVSAAIDCQPITALECLSEALIIPQVVAATATAFTDQLPATSPNGLTAANPYLAGQWRTTPQASYSFRTSLTPDSHNYSAGTFSLRPFDWESSLRARPATWLTAAVTEKVSLNGDVLQERDPLGIPSAAKFGYGLTSGKISTQILPYLQAHNAEYPTVFFESFENAYTSDGIVTVVDGNPHTTPGVVVGEDGFAFTSNISLTTCTAQTSHCPVYAHTGNSCALLDGQQIRLMPVVQTAQLNAGDLLIKAWVHYQMPGNAPVALQDVAVSFVDLSSFNPSTGAYTPISPSTGGGISFTAIAQTGDWLLFEARIQMNTTGLSVGEFLVPTLNLVPPKVGAISATVWVDDIRMQPAEAQMTTYVYDPTTMRLVASFDDQHFALRYQYNAEGKLIRKQADTERGVKTLQETHYHTPTTTQVDE